MRRAIVLLAALLSGCFESDPQPPVVKHNGVVISDAWGAASVQVITLTDGTRCAVLVGANKGSISCDWGGNAGR